MAIIKHIASKNQDYTAAERYLIFEHNEKTGKHPRPYCVEQRSETGHGTVAL